MFRVSLMLVTILMLAGCDTPYSRFLGPGDIDKYVESTGEETVCLNDGFDVICIKTIPGETGETGETGEQGEKGEKGEQGDLGPRGQRGPRGLRGPTGQDGKIIIVEKIVEKVVERIVERPANVSVDAIVEQVAAQLGTTVTIPEIIQETIEVVQETVPETDITTPDNGIIDDITDEIEDEIQPDPIVPTPDPPIITPDPPIITPDPPIITPDPPIITSDPEPTGSPGCHQITFPIEICGESVGSLTMQSHTPHLSATRPGVEKITWGGTTDGGNSGLITVCFHSFNQAVFDDFKAKVQQGIDSIKKERGCN